MSLQRFFKSASQIITDGSAQTTVRPGAFIACPLAVFAAPGGLPGSWQQDIYQIAFDQAQAAARRPSLFERDWLGTWN
jgi:hypothetical protein